MNGFQTSNWAASYYASVFINIYLMSRWGQWLALEVNYHFVRLFLDSACVYIGVYIRNIGESGASAWDESIGFLIKCIMIDLILHELKIIQDQWISFEIWTLNPWFCEVNYYFKYMAEECFMPVLAKLSVCDGKNGITMYCVFQ